MVALKAIFYIWGIIAILGGIGNISSNISFAGILILIGILSFPIVYSNIKKYFNMKNFSYIYALLLVGVFILNYILFPAQNTNITQTPKVDIIDKQAEIIQEEISGEVVEFTYETYSEGKKKMLYIELVKAQDKAWKEAEKKLPTNGSDVCPTLNNCMTQVEIAQRLELNQKEAKLLKEKYEQEFRDEFGISIEDQSRLSAEGNAKLWPLPNY